MGYAASLTILTTCKTEMSVTSSTDDDYITYLIKAVSDYIASRCNRNFTYSAAWSENVAAYAQPRLIVTHTPVISVTSITYNGSTISSDTYSLVDAGKGWIFNRSGWYWTAALYPNIAQDPYVGSENALYAVTYAGGYVTPQQAADNVALTRSLPYDLEQACVQGVVSLYRARGQDQRISQESLLSYSVGYREVEEVSAVANVIRRYRRIGTGR
jgi:hypothetical protein